MKSIDQVVALANAFADARGIGEARVSTLVFNDGKRISRVREGADIGVRSVERAVQWFSDNWPEGVDWPLEVPRPEPVSSESAA